MTSKKKQCEHPDGCHRHAVAKGWCFAHWERMHKTGKLGPAEIRGPGRTNRKCKVEDCSKSVGKDGGYDYCGKHYQRYKKHGRVDVVKKGGASLPKEKNPFWAGDNISYHGVHLRLRYWKRPARQYLCVDCKDRQAMHWSYDGKGGDKERVDEVGTYSIDLDNYQPRCVPCHSAYDRALLTGEPKELD